MLIPPTTGMALPVLKTLSDSASYAKTLAPFLPQLSTLPSTLLASISDPSALSALYTATNPAISGLAFSIVLMPIFLLVSEANKNYSQVDRVWSLLPTVYNLHYAVWARMAGLPTAKVDNVLAFSVLWSARLTFNYWRKGGYEVGSEDYRWALIKTKIGQPWFFLLNVLFVSSVQSVILWAVTTPTYLLLLSSRLSPTLTWPDALLARSLILLVIVSYFADAQQWNYQQAKKSYNATAKIPQDSGFTRQQLDRGFITTGLWRYSRHPNFAAEQAIWVVLYAWASLDTQTWWNWTAAGVVSYLAVFAGSTPITERISAGKYSDYSVYQQRVGRFLPKFFGKGWDEAEMEGRQPATAQGGSGKKKR